MNRHAQAWFAFEKMTKKMVEMHKVKNIDYEKWLLIKKHEEANEWMKSFGIVEFWSSLTNTKTPILNGKFLKF
jgi:hypothetical protein